MHIPWNPRAPKAKLPPVERARQKVYRWKWAQVGALAVNTITMAGLAGFLTSRDLDVAGGAVVPIIMVRTTEDSGWFDEANMALC